MDEDAAFEALEAEIAPLLDGICQHAEARIITWPQARKISRVLDERWLRYGLELAQAREACAYVAGRHTAVLRKRRGGPTRVAPVQ